MNRIVGTVIILLGLLGGFKLFEQYALKEKQRRNVHADQARRVVADAAKSGTLSPEDDFTTVDQSAVFRVMAFLYRAEQDHYSVSDTAAAAAAGASGRSGALRLITERIEDNYAIAKQLGVFKDINNILRMERGLPPVAHANGWEDEEVTVGHMISPLLAPELARSLANLVLMPASLRNLRGDDLTSFTPEASKKWLAEGLITPESHKAIMAELEKKTKRGI